MPEGTPLKFSAAMWSIVSGEVPPRKKKNSETRGRFLKPEVSILMYRNPYSSGRWSERANIVSNVGKVLKNGLDAQKWTKSKSHQFVTLFPLTLA